MDAAPAVDHNRCWGSIAETYMFSRRLYFSDCYTVAAAASSLFIFVGYSHLLHPLDGWGRIPHCFTGQHNVPHPGGGHCSVEGENPSRSCKSTRMLHQPTEEIWKTLQLTESGLQGGRRIFITWTSHVMCAPLYELWVLTSDTMGPLSTYQL